MNPVEDISEALQRAQKQGLITIRGVERECGISRNTARTALRGTRCPRPEIEDRLWQYLREKGAA